MPVVMPAIIQGTVEPAALFLPRQLSPAQSVSYSLLADIVPKSLAQPSLNASVHA